MPENQFGRQPLRNASQENEFLAEEEAEPRLRRQNSADAWKIVGRICSEWSSNCFRMAVQREATDGGTALPFETLPFALYNLGRNSLPDATSNPAPAPKPRRWGIIAAGLILLALGLVVIYTSRAAFFSPLALVVVAAIGLAALLLQLRLRKDKDPRAPVRAPLWLNVLGLVFAIAAVFADIVRLSANLMLIAALGAVVCFGISGTAVLHTLHKKKV